MHLRAEIIAKIKNQFQTIHKRADELALLFILHPYTSRKGHEYAHQGFIRRVRTLERCVNNVFEIIPPETTERPDKSQLDDAQINLQAFYANIYGATDNLAWIWVFERGLKIGRGQVGLRKKHREVRDSFGAPLRKYLESLDEWFDYVVEYRDAVAHRIPLYIPLRVPRADAEKYNDLMRRMNEMTRRFDFDEYNRLYVQQESLLVFEPLITHSASEATSQIIFHSQLLNDFSTLEELGRKMRGELQSLRSSVQE